MAANHEHDLMMALQLQAQFQEELRSHFSDDSSGNPLPNNLQHRGGARNGQKRCEDTEQEKLSISLVDPTWEMIDPNPDIHTLFIIFNDQFFWGRLAGIEVKWSPRMTVCAGVCSYERRGGLCSVRLSVPLLKLRPRKDLIETLLHEMIHAFLFVTENNKDHDGHGPEFHKQMYRINRIAGTNISVYHNFHDEVALYRQHVWQCNGPCLQRPPYYGLLKRCMNRPPSARDPWWGCHQNSCGGSYTKVQEPEGFQDRNEKRKHTDADSSPNKNGDIRTFFPDMKKKNLIGSQQGSGASGTSGQKNIHGMNQTSSGTVKSVSVNGATRANVHGFIGNVGGKGRGGFGTAMAGQGGGSRTVTVKGGRGNSLGESIGEMTPQLTRGSEVFCGKGFSLGGSAGTGVSRLLLEHKVDSKIEKKVQKKIEKNLDKEKDFFTQCPVCNICVPRVVLDQHLNDCLGNFEDDLDWQENLQVNPTEEVLLSSDDEEPMEVLPHSDANDSIILLDANSSAMDTAERCACPVCGEMLLQLKINQHLDQHFSQ